MIMTQELNIDVHYTLPITLSYTHCCVSLHLQVLSSL